MQSKTTFYSKSKQANHRPLPRTGSVEEDGERALIATGTLDSFRSAYGMREIGPDGSIAIDALCARTLEVGEGDEVWSVAR